MQSVTCLTADPGVVSSIPAWSHTFMEVDHEIISTTIIHPSADSRRVVVSYKQKYVHEGMVKGLVKYQILYCVGNSDCHFRVQNNLGRVEHSELVGRALDCG